MDAMSVPLFTAVLGKFRAFVGLKEGKRLVKEAHPVLDLPWAPGKGNAIQDRLDDIGFPWRLSCQQLIDQFGLTRHPVYGWERSPVTPCPFKLDGLISPLSPAIMPSVYRDQVPLWFAAEVWVGQDPFANLHHAHRQFSQWFGPAPIGVIHNTVSSCWHAGPARIKLTIWPRELQSAHRAIEEKKLEAACSISIEPGYRQPMTQPEREWLESFSSVAAVCDEALPQTLEAVWANAPDVGSRDFMRLPPVDQDNFLSQIGLSSDGMALIVCAQQLHIVPMDCVVALELQKIRPAKGRGGARLSLIYHASSGMERSLDLSRRVGEVDALDDLAFLLRERLGCPLRMPEPYDDC